MKTASLIRRESKQMRNDDYVFLLIIFMSSILFGMLPIVVTRCLSPQKRNRSKTVTYECGIAPEANSWVKFRVQYYVYALLFLVFDIEAIFLFPWAVDFAQMGFASLYNMVIFLIILTFGLAYAWMKGFLHWT